MNTMTQFQKQQGAALIVGLIMMVVITVLAISGMNTATTELAMARNDQNYENAFQSAETGLEQALAQGSFQAFAGNTVLTHTYGNESVSSEIVYEDSTHVPDAAFSLGGGVKAYHFLVTATAESRRAPGSPTDRDSFATHSQAFYVIGPEQNTIN
ncbi:MAG: pilus assembly PilX N-terminal domain-containing protein [Gammaproteobacteria bacterium]|nr:pilus assembly PilX N-terminal domain-containing protein [Gammaproteobacteria bacterium]MDH3374946.1 pilus assembly PilX N-terminal domain-containing protein [Gammaproteobacteria bacterium]MDH3408104.1 pilus assembly PilX N-terminal domain-containing protein [Gammaproteobacteria bacterium]MDH3552749.1 pilus assembly PilX N-terminal domain-containing protein [Gammaproteobacteria bacterium]